jgi:hypothetical protein
MPWTKVAEAYPHGVAEVLATSLAIAAGLKHTRIDLDSAAAASSRRLPRDGKVAEKAAREWRSRN